jgi:hypothetical protein
MCIVIQFNYSFLGLVYLNSCQKVNIMFEFKSVFLNVLISTRAPGSYMKKLKLVSRKPDLTP